MNEALEVKGSVRKLEQKRKRDLPDSLQHIFDFGSFDAELSPSGHLLLETSYTYGGFLYRHTHYEYDEAGRVVRTASVGATGETLGSSELTYAESKCIWVNRDPLGILSSHGVDDYSGKHLLSTATFDRENKPKRVKTFEYSGDRLVKSDSLYYLPDGTVYEHCLSDYDSAGRIHKTYRLKADGSPLGDGKYLYEYNQEGRRSKTWTLNEFGEEIATSVTIYEYVDDEIGNWIERHEYHMWRDDSYRSKHLTTRTLTYY